MTGSAQNRYTWSGWRTSDRGSVSAFVLVLVIGLIMLAGLGLDGGLALAAKVRASGQAESAARAGAQAVDLATYRATGQLRLDPARAQRLAYAYLSTVGAIGTVEATADTITVHVDETYHTQLLSLAGIDAIAAHGVGAAHPQRGISAVLP
ncbi:pilus assembly protein TadG-related protein [Amycolatopsis sp. cmx-4-68]|uniref:pilus assembly protein TadG-related protein n=1 Tax=Amycolatopsis sp. cmx-4-68 TaxID=2790938 RepID=UPI00397B3553